MTGPGIDAKWSLGIGLRLDRRSSESNPHGRIVAIPPTDCGSRPLIRVARCQLLGASLTGERRTPPEDCGGTPGFQNLLEAIRDPEHEEHDELLDWLGGNFDPDAFSVDEVNRRLAAMQRRRSKAAAQK